MAGLSRMAVIFSRTREQKIALVVQVVLAPVGIGSVGSRNKNGVGLKPKTKYPYKLSLEELSKGW